MNNNNSKNFSSLKAKKEEAAEKCREAGNAEFKRGDFTAAIKQYNKSIELNATVTAYANRAQVHLCVGSYDDAIRDAESALNMDPAHLKARFRLGRAFFCKKMFDKAVDHYEKCLEQEPENVQVRQAIEQCKQAMASSSTDASGSTTTTTQPSSVEEPPKFRFQSILVCSFKLGLREVGVDEHQWDRFENLAGLREALATARPVGPIAQIYVMDVDLDTSGMVYQFFASLDPRMLEGGDLEFHGSRGDDRAFRRFIQLFKPKSLIVDCVPMDEWNFDAYMCRLDHPIRNAKLLALYPLFFPAEPSRNLAAEMYYAKVSQQTVLDWLHSPSPHCSPAWNPPKPVQIAHEVPVCTATKQCQEFGGSVWRHPADKLLCIGECSLFNDQQQQQNNPEGEEEAANVDTLIDQCHKLFRQATRRLNYSVKVIHEVDFNKPSFLPRAFTNTLGEQLRVSVQHLCMVNDEGSEYALQFPPQDLVTIERFHTS